MRENVSPPSITHLSNNRSSITRLSVDAKATAIRAAIGAVLGLAWGAALRAWMVVLVLEFGDRPQFTWLGTFGGILLPAAIVGAVLGIAAGGERTVNPRWQGWIILSPLLFVLAPAVVVNNFFSILITTGMGGGAIGVALLFTLAAAVALVIGDSGATDTPSKVFCALLFALLMALLVAGIGVSTQHRSKIAN